MNSEILISAGLRSQSNLVTKFMASNSTVGLLRTSRILASAAKKAIAEDGYVWLNAATIREANDSALYNKIKWRFKCTKVETFTIVKTKTGYEVEDSSVRTITSIARNTGMTEDEVIDYVLGKSRVRKRFTCYYFVISDVDSYEVPKAVSEFSYIKTNEQICKLPQNFYWVKN